MEKFKKICEVSDITECGFYVYAGYDRKTEVLKYVQTTTDIPSAAIQKEIESGIDLIFEIVYIGGSKQNINDMKNYILRYYPTELNAKEVKVIEVEKPVEKKKRIPKLTDEILKGRVGDAVWCQKCFRRRVKNGHVYCFSCAVIGKNYMNE